jgi:hypothetical protein
MSAASVKRLSSATAMAINDAIDVARTAAELDTLTKLVWRGYADGEIGEDDAGHLDGRIRLRRPIRRIVRQAAPGLPLPEPNACRIGCLPERRVQRSPDKQASYDRRHRLAFDSVMPRHLGARLTIGQMAVMRVVADEYVKSTRCELTLDEIAARAGVCRKTARRAMTTARAQNLISVELRPVRGRKHRPNLVQIISFEWLNWSLRAKTKRDQASEPIGGHFVSPTKITTSGGR